MSEAPAPTLNVRAARETDAGLIHRFVRELADYEKLLHAVKASEADLAALLFGPAPRAFCDIVEAGGEAAGFCLWFYTVSTFEGRAGLWIEDLYVTPAARGLGAGKALLQAAARRCVAEKLGRLDWAVLDWNAPAVGFYDRVGAQRLDDWRLRRLSGDALSALAQES